MIVSKKFFNKRCRDVDGHQSPHEVGLCVAVCLDKDNRKKYFSIMLIVLDENYPVLCQINQYGLIWCSIWWDKLP